MVGKRIKAVWCFVFGIPATYQARGGVHRVGARRADPAWKRQKSSPGAENRKHANRKLNWKVADVRGSGDGYGRRYCPRLFQTPQKHSVQNPAIPQLWEKGTAIPQLCIPKDRWNCRRGWLSRLRGARPWGTGFPLAKRVGWQRGGEGGAGRPGGSGRGHSKRHEPLSGSRSLVGAMAAGCQGDMLRAVRSTSAAGSGFGADTRGPLRHTGNRWRTNLAS